MSKRENTAKDRSIEAIPNQSGYAAIPIPPRLMESAKPSARNALSRLSKIRLRHKTRPVPTRAEIIRKKDLEQAIAIAVVVNLLVIFPLLFIVIKTPALSDGSFVSVEAGEENAAKDKKSEIFEDASGQALPASKNLLAGAASSSSTGIQVVSLSTMGIQLDMMQFEPPPLSFGRSIASYEMGGVPGIDRAFLESLLPKSRFGNGTRLALFVDDSGSMRKISGAVASFVNTTFPRARVRVVDDCKMFKESNSFAVHLGDAALNSQHTTSSLSATFRTSKRKKESRRSEVFSLTATMRDAFTSSAFTNNLVERLLKCSNRLEEPSQ